MIASSPNGPWEPLETEQVLVDGRVEAVTPHFSILTTMLSSIVDLVGEARHIFDDATGGFLADAEQPTCGGEDQARRTLSINSTAAGTVKWCLGVERGVTVLRVTNNLRYALQASHPGLTVTNANLDTTSLAAVTAKIDQTLVLLAPRRAVTFRVDGTTAGLTTEFNGLADSLYQLQIGIETLLAILSRFGAAGADAVAATASLLQSPKCAATIGDPTGGNVLANCFSAGDILRAFGAKAVFAAALMTVGPLIEFFHSRFNAIGDIISGRDRYQIKIGAAAPPAAVTSVPCSPNCEITGQVAFQHPTWGTSTLVTATTHYDKYCSSAGDVYVVDTGGTVRWSTHMEYGCGEPIEPNAPPTDSTGNLFVIYNPGRYHGTVVLRPVPDGIDDLHTTAEDVGRFYYSDVSDVDGDGVFEITQYDNDCNPDCADGTITSEIFRWNGSDYAAS